MKIVVLTKQVPDTWSDRRLDAASGRVDRAASDAVVDEIAERALEVALLHQDATGAEVVALTLGPASAEEILRRALAMGADSAIHVRDDAFVGADLSLTSAILASVVRTTGADLVIAGNESTDGRGGVIPAMLAEHLGMPHLTNLDSLSIDGDTISGTRSTEDGSATLHAQLPAVISVTERSAEPRFPSFKGIMRAKKKPFQVVSAADLSDIDLTSRTVVLSAIERPARTAGIKINDDGTAAQQLVDFLAGRRLV